MVKQNQEIKQQLRQTVRNAVSQSHQKLIDKIVDEFRDRSRKDIKAWREARAKIDDPMYPSRKEYIVLSKELGIDAHLTSQFEVRRQAFLSKKFRVMRKTGEENEAATELFKRPWFRTTQERYFETNVDGTELLEVNEIVDGEIDSINVLPKGKLIPEKKRIKLTDYDMDGTEYDTDQLYPYLFELGRADKWGLMDKLAPQIIWKRNYQQAWADFAQLFGMPLRVATTNKTSDKDWDKIEAMLDQLGEAGTAIFPEGTKYELVGDTRADAFQVFNQGIERCNSEMSKAINLVTMLSDNGSSKSQSEVHFKVNAQIIEADMTGFEYEMTYDIFDRLRRLGGAYSVIGEDDYFEFDRTESLSIADQWKMVKEALQFKHVPNDWIEKTFGIPVEDKPEPTGGNFNPGSGRPAPQNRFDVKSLLPSLPEACCHSSTQLGGSRGVDVRGVADPDPYAEDLERIAEYIFHKEYTQDIPSSLYLEYARQLVAGFTSGFKSRIDGIDYDSPDNYKLAMFHANIFRFSAASTWQDVMNINKMREEASSYDEFERMVKSYTNVKTNHLRAEWNRSEATAQNAANWLRQVEQKNDYDLRYLTVGDSRVRQEHQSLDNFTAPVEDPVWDRIYPPNAWNCRCEVIQIPAGSSARSLDSQIDPDAIQKGFKGNRGKTNVIFEDAHEYFKEFPETKNMNRRTFGLGTMADIDRSGLKVIPDAIKDQEEFIRVLQEKANQFDGKAAYFQDFLGRWYQAPVSDFKSKFRKPDKTQRWSSFELLDEIILNPDEVWIVQENRKNNKYSTRYLKNYKDKLMVAVTGTEADKMKVITWYPVQLDETKIGNERTGLMIKKKD